MPVTGESIRLARLFSEGKNAVVVAVDHGLYFGPLPGMIDLPSVMDRVSGADAVLMAHPLPSKRTRSSLPSPPTTTSSFMESPQVGFSCAMACGMWSRRAALRGAR